MCGEYDYSQIDAPLGFSKDAWAVVRCKPDARILDCTAGNRHIHGKLKEDPEYCSRIIFTDKEPNLRIKSDLLTEWRDLPKHFPRDYFNCAILDPNFYTRTGTPAPKWYQAHHGDPQEKDGSWWGQPFITQNEMRKQLLEAQRAIATVSPRMCLKWTDSQHSVDRIITIFTEWKTVLPFYPIATGSFKKNATGSIYWVKLVRRGGAAP